MMKSLWVLLGLCLTFASFNVDACELAFLPAFSGKVNNFSNIPNKKIKIRISWSVEDTEHNPCVGPSNTKEISISDNGSFTIPITKYWTYRYADGESVSIRVTMGDEDTNTYYFEPRTEVAKMKMFLKSLNLYSLKATTIHHTTSIADSIGDLSKAIDSGFRAKKAFVYFSNAINPKDGLEYLFLSNSHWVGYSEWDHKEYTDVEVENSYFLVSGTAQKNPKVIFEYGMALPNAEDVFVAYKKMTTSYSGQLPSEMKNIEINPKFTSATCVNNANAAKTTTVVAVNDRPYLLTFLVHGKKIHQSPLFFDEDHPKAPYGLFNNSESRTDAEFATLSQGVLRLLDVNQKLLSTYTCTDFTSR